ncbi:MAG TPA: ABC transporter substrate-binding protein [Acetobacteraceae bacterium]|nr:ABC transporter substrate-binding protein [Acetobacteraceae bacterium]
MLTRRAFLVTSVAAVSLFAAGPSAWAQSAADATNFVVNLGNNMAAVVNGPGSLEQKKQRMQPLIEQSVDVDGIARFSLGRFWRTATPEQQARYLQLFHAVLINNIASKMGEFQGVTFRTTTTAQREGEFFVGTIITRPNQQPNNVQWVVSTANGRPQIIDVIAEGTSLRLTQRSDYGSYLARNGNNVDALISAMRQQLGA